MVTYAKISPKMVNPRDIAGIAEEKELQREKFLVSGSVGAMKFEPSYSAVKNW